MSIFASDKPSAESGHINVIATIHAKPEHAAEVKAMFASLVEPSRKEDGCKGYHLHVDKNNSSVFYTYEEWTGEDKLTAHLEGAKPMLEKVKPLLASDLNITVLEHLI